ncbi:hypothetical protein FEM48_Zijuj06G0116300 [Ziziphus jujuba var. spinosa]|uniref:Uncharacterized protein n=1 Tax=Ziziphus jujuba var. spinosa TaxID=714518 RepID=A0A978V926_ZIZJJ|nr:hypothetical protein FEM48_Zijuj06G0116300 [Ziziphus jujuba var. spinosa]
MRNIGFLALDTNNLYGSLPASLGNLTNVGGIYIYDNRISGHIPREIGNLTNLSSLQLFGNQFSGNIPKEVGILKKMSTLMLQQNQLSGREVGSLAKIASACSSSRPQCRLTMKEISKEMLTQAAFVKAILSHYTP